MQPIINEIISNPVAFLRFMKDNRYEVVHQSNLFYRDIEFAAVKYVEQKTGKKISYFGAMEKAADEICAAFDRAGILKKVSAQAYVVNCEEFMLPRPEVKAAPAPAAAAAPAA